MIISSERVTWREWLIFFGFVVLILALHYLGPLQYIEKPILKGLRWVAQQTRHVLLPPESNQPFSMQASVPENQLRIAELERKNQQLLQELQFTRSQPNRTTSAYIIKQEQTDTGIFITLDQGLDEGVNVDEPIARNGVFLGKIVRLEKHKSIAQWIFDPAVSVSATVEGNEKAYGLVRGTKGAALVMEMVPQDVHLEIGQIVVTRGLEQQTPERLYLGKIVKIEQKTGDLFQQAILQQPTLGDIDFVTIIHSL